MKPLIKNITLAAEYNRDLQFGEVTKDDQSAKVSICTTDLPIRGSPQRAHTQSVRD